MADETVIVSARQPNLRFGTSFLNTKYRDRAAEDEVLMDKSTGELAYVRPGTKDFMYFTRENFNLENWLLFMRSVYESNRFEEYPTTLNCSEIDSTYLLGTQFDLESFNYDTDSDGEEITNFADGAILGNNDPLEYNVTHEASGIFVELHARPRDVVLINMISRVFDDYFENYTGSNSKYNAEKNRLLGDETYKGSNAEIHYTLRMYKDNAVKTIIAKSGYCRVNQPCYLSFDTSVLSREDYDKITISIDYIALPKMKYFNNPLSKTVNEQKVIQILDDISSIQLKSLDVFSFTTMTDLDYNLPSSENGTMLTLLHSSAFEEAMDRISKISKADGIITSVEAPTDDEWVRISLWAERIRNVFTKGATEDTGSESNFSDLDAFFGKAEEVSGPFVLNVGLNGFYIEVLGRLNYTLDTSGW